MEGRRRKGGSEWREGGGREVRSGGKEEEGRLGVEGRREKGG